MTEKEKSHAEMLYQPGDPELAADRDVTVKSCMTIIIYIPLTVKHGRPPYGNCWAMWEKTASWSSPFSAHTDIIHQWEIIFS